MKTLKILAGVLFLTPLVARAQYYGTYYEAPMSPITNANGLISRLASLGTAAVYILVALGFLYIVYAIVQYFIKGKEGESSRREAGMQILWGIVGLALILSMWGIVNLLINTFTTNTNNLPNLPNANFVGGQSSAMCGNVVMPSNGGGFNYSCQNGTLIAVPR